MHITLNLIAEEAFLELFTLEYKAVKFDIADFKNKLFAGNSEKTMT